MSSLQKFHRRTQSVSSAVDLTDNMVPTYGGDGTGSDTIGYWLGNVGSYKLRVAPKSTEISGQKWGSEGILRGTTFVNNGLVNTNKLMSFGTAAHPIAGRCKYLTTGGYNTWYLPAKNELGVIYSSKSKTPFATTNAIAGNIQWCSTEYDANIAWGQNWDDAGKWYVHSVYNAKSNGAYYARAVRRTLI